MTIKETFLLSFFRQSCHVLQPSSTNKRHPDGFSLVVLLSIRTLSSHPPSPPSRFPRRWESAVSTRLVRARLFRGSPAPTANSTSTPPAWLIHPHQRRHLVTKFVLFASFRQLGSRAVGGTAATCADAGLCRRLLLAANRKTGRRETRTD